MLALLFFSVFQNILWSEQPIVLVPGADEIYVFFMDVGQGDSTLIFSHDAAVLIDAGEFRYRNTVLGYLRQLGITRLDYIIATHPHSDHIGGLPTVISQLEVGRILMPDTTNNTAAFENLIDAIDNHEIPLTVPVPGQQFSAGVIQFTVLHPPQGFPGGINNNSIIIRLDHGYTSFMFTGDAERQAELALISSGMPIEANVLRVGHHGSRTSSIPEFLDAVNPDVAVISVGANNQHGHPNRDVIDNLVARNIQIFRTDEMGTVIMRTNGLDIQLIRKEYANVLDN